MKNKELGWVNAMPYEKDLVFGIPSSLFENLKLPLDSLQFKLVIHNNQLMLVGPSLGKARPTSNDISEGDDIIG